MTDRNKNNGVSIMDSGQIFIIAEIGVTCNYDMETTKKLVKAAHSCGADAVKLNFHFPDELMSDRDVSYTYRNATGTKTENMFDMFNSLRFTFEEWSEIKDFCDHIGIEFFGSVDGKTSIEWGDKLGFNYFKVGTWDISDVIMWEQLAKLNKPVIVDVGASPESEIQEMINIMGAENLIILHDYHTSAHSEMNMLSIKHLIDEYDIVTGFSSPNTYDVNDYMAVALGASVIEKRLTLDQNADGHHHILSKTPDQYAEWVSNIRQAEAALGKCGIYPSTNDLKERKDYFKHLCAPTDLKAGTTLTLEHLAAKRPEIDNALKPKDYTKLIGKTLKVGLKKNTAFKLGDVE